MKITRFGCLLLIFFLLFSCEEDKRIPIKIIKAKDGYYEWYYYSLITSEGPDYVDYIDENCKRILIYKGHRVTNINLNKEILYIECYECNTLELNSNFSNRIQLINNDNAIDYAEASRKRDSLKRNLTKISCE